jgi:hypothetical protein
MYANEGYASLYFAFRHDYHATTTLMGRSPFKGLQHWSYRDEPPVIWPSPAHASKTRAWGMDTAVMEASGVKFRDKVWHEGPPHVLVARWENIWHHYVLTRTTLLLLISSDYQPREDIWVIDTKRCGSPELGQDALSYPNRLGRMHFAQRPARMEEIGDTRRVIFPGRARTHLYAFSNGSFRLEEFDPAGGSLRFGDDTGTYELEYELRFFTEVPGRPVLRDGEYITEEVRTVAQRIS